MFIMLGNVVISKKRVKGRRRGTSRRTANKLLLKRRNPNLYLSLKLSASTASRLVTGSGTAPSLADKKDGKVNKGIFDIQIIDVYFTSVRRNPSVFDTGSVANICNSKQGLRIKRRLAKDEVTMRVGNGSKVYVIAVGTLPLHLPPGLVLDLNNCYLVPSLSMNIISGSCLMRDSYSFKSENNGCSIYMSNILWSCTLDEWSIFTKS